MQITQAIYCFSKKKKKMKTRNIKKRTPLNYMGSYKQNKVSFYIYISRGNDRETPQEISAKTSEPPL